jgi:hypothetical protein
MEDQIPALQAKILDEEKSCHNKLKEIEDEWEKTRPRTARGTNFQMTGSGLISLSLSGISHSNRSYPRKLL